MDESPDNKERGIMGESMKPYPQGGISLKITPFPMDGNPKNKEIGMEGRENESLQTGWNYMKSNFVHSLTIICPIFYTSHTSR